MTNIKQNSTAGIEQQKKSMAEQMWLYYYNQTLYEKGLITEQERNKMKVRIANRKSKSMSRSIER